MKSLTREWVEKAIEKYIKARLQEAGIEFGKVHDLVKLLELAVRVEPLWEPYRPTFRPVSAYAVEFRYPGENASKEEAKDAIKICRAFRKTARWSLGLKL